MTFSISFQKVRALLFLATLVVFSISFSVVLTEELAHRFGSFLTGAAGNPFGMLGRALAHWGVFFDADFSPMDGNDWVENGDGTFTLKRSYLDEAAFKRTPVGMPYNDLDLYTFGLLDPNKVNSPFVIENPTLEDGRALRMHSSGNLVEIQNPDGTWSGPFYLPTDLMIKGTRRSTHETKQQDAFLSELVAYANSLHI